MWLLSTVLSGSVATLRLQRVPLPRRAVLQSYQRLFLMVETLQSAVTPNVELYSGVSSEVSGQQQLFYQQIEESGVWIATAEQLRHKCAPVYS